MKMVTLSSLVVLFAIASMVAIAPQAFAEHGATSVTVENAPGSSVPGCEDTAEGCFIPNIATVVIGGTVTWENGDTAAHTSTAGSATEGPSGVWDSSLIMAGSSFSHTFDAEGSFDYFCMVHPWMAGTVIVEAEAAHEEEVYEEVHEEEVHEEEVHEEQAEVVYEKIAPTMSVGSTTTTGGSGPGDMTDLLHWNISGGDVLSMHVNEDNASLVIDMTSYNDGELFVALDETYIGSDDGTFFVIVGGEESNDYEQAGNDLFISFPAGTESIEIVGSYAVPEFGTIAMIVLAVAIVSIIVLTTKTKTQLIPKL
jgi:predicted secreted protein with PEFG-CTERM motif